MSHLSLCKANNRTVTEVASFVTGVNVTEIYTLKPQLVEPPTGDSIYPHVWRVCGNDVYVMFKFISIDRFSSVRSGELIFSHGYQNG